MKKYELLICKSGRKRVLKGEAILEERNIYANDVKSLLEYFNLNYKGFRVAYIQNATIDEMSELRSLELNL